MRNCSFDNLPLKFNTLDSLVTFHNKDIQNRQTRNLITGFVAVERPKRWWLTFLVHPICSVVQLIEKNDLLTFQ